MARKTQVLREHESAPANDGRTIHTRDADLKYQHNRHLEASISSDEDARRLRLQVLFLQDEVDSLNSKIWDEQERVHEAQDDVDHWRTEADGAGDRLKRVTNDLRSRTRELDILKAQLESMQDVSADSTKLLTEKISLTRELANLRPELEDLRSQSQQNEGLLAEKLELQRQLKTLKAELNDERRAASTKSHSDESQKVDQLRKELSTAKKDRDRIEKEASKASAAWSAEKEVLQDKLDQFRTKLRSTKEKLKETEGELTQARTSTSTRTSAISTKSNNPRKRNTVEFDPDAALGTPGDGAHQTKRIRRAPSVVGEQSNFSLTPFLQRTSSVAVDNATVDDDKPVDSVEDTESPTVTRATSTSRKEKKTPLAPASPGKSNLKVKPAAIRKSAPSKPSLEAVVEEEPVEEEPAEEQEQTETVEQPPQEDDAPKPVAEKKKISKVQLRPKKSLLSFASFREGSVQPAQQQQQQKKKRKLLGNAPKTLFDEDDEDAEASTANATRNAGAQRAFGAFGGKGFTGLSALNAGKRKGLMVVKEDGFMFSPLKKDRRAAREASVALAA